MSKIDSLANHAVFQLQMDTRTAANFIQQRCNCSDIAATNAVKAATTFHKR